MSNLDQRLRIAFDLNLARRQAAQSVPFSVAWDAATTRMEDLEREIWRLRRAAPLIAAIATPHR